MNGTLLKYYQAIERASADMLLAARGQDWEQVITLEGTCSVLVSQLKREAAGDVLNDMEQEEKGRIMRRILENDARIRALAEPWIDDLDRLVNGAAVRLH